MPSNWQGMVGEVEKALKVIGDKVRQADESQLNTTLKFMTGRSNRAICGGSTSSGTC